MKKFHIYEPVLGTWYEQNGRKRMDGVVDLAPIRARKHYPALISAPDSQTALHIAKMQDYKTPIIGEVPEFH